MKHLFVAGVVLFGAATNRAADDPRAIIDAALKAMGGADKISKFKGEQWKAKGTMEMMGQKMTYNADYFFAAPSMLRFDLSMEIGTMKIALTAATDGKVAWEKMGDMMREMEAKKARAFHHSVYVIHLSQLTPLKDKEYTLAMVDPIKVDGQEAVGIKVSRKDRPDVTLYFDKKTSLLAKTSTTAWDEFTDKDVVQEVLLGNWKEKDGLKYFHKLTIRRDGKDFIVEEYSEQKALEKIDTKMFAKP